MMSLRTRCQKIFTFFQQHAQGTVRAAAAATGMSKSAAHRQKQALARRNQYPESWFWETEEGAQWLGLLMSATIYCCGIRGGMGMDALSDFFIRLRVHTHLGVSPRSLFRVAAEIETQLLQYQTQHGQGQAEGTQVIIGADETFFEDVVFVMMDLCSGYIFVEEAAADRTFLTWQERARHALDAVGVTARYMVSDQAQALAKLAREELQCRRIPDLFHATHEVVKLFGGRLARKAASLHRKMTQTQLAIEALIQQEKPSERIDVQKQALRELHAAHTVVLERQTRYYTALHAMSLTLHPFSLEYHGAHTSAEAEAELAHVLETLRALAAEFGITDSKHRFTKVEKQVPDLAGLLDLWWLWVTESLNAYALPAELHAWLRDVLLPSVYWQMQTQRTSSGSLRQTYARAAKQTHDRLQRHALTQVLATKELTRWRSWATWMVMKFQRTSSAVEGRNGVLSCMNHTQRSIPTRRLQVATVIHNFGIRREDGTTAAERLFGQPFPDPFDWVVERMGELPRPRHRMAKAS